MVFSVIDKFAVVAFDTENTVDKHVDRVLAIVNDKKVILSSGAQAFGEPCCLCTWSNPSTIRS